MAKNLELPMHCLSQNGWSLKIALKTLETLNMLL
jgi:hypothetical protein